MLGAELALLPNQNGYASNREDLKKTVLNQLNAVGKMSHVPVTDGGK